MRGVIVPPSKLVVTIFVFPKGGFLIKGEITPFCFDDEMKVRSRRWKLSCQNRYLYLVSWPQSSLQALLSKQMSISCIMAAVVFASSLVKNRCLYQKQTLLSFMAAAAAESARAAVIKSIYTYTISLSLSMYVCMYVYVYIYIYTHTHYVYIYIYTHRIHTIYIQYI